MGSVRVFGVALTLAALLGVSRDARALDVEVTSQTSTQIYDVRGGEPGLFLTRRRVAERLGLLVTGLLPGEERPGYDGPRLSFEVRLRLDAEFGFDRREIRPTSSLWFVPGFDPYALDLMIAQLRLRGLFNGTTDVRAGRLITFDPTGFGSLDGLEVSVRLPWHVKAWVRGGVDVVAGQRLSSGTFDTDGVLQTRRDELWPDDALGVRDPPTRLVLAGGIALTGFDHVAAQVAYRHGLVPGDALRQSYQRLAGTVSVDAGPFRAEASAGGDLLLNRMDELSLELGYRPLSWLDLALFGGYEAPVFDTDSIFAVFWSDPSIDVELRARVRPASWLTLGVSGLVRQLGVLGLSQGVFDAEGLRFGGTAYGRLRLGWFTGELRGRLGLGYGGRKVGVSTRLVARLPRAPLSFDLRGILLGTEQDIQPRDRVINLGYVIGARYRISHDASLLFELEHNGSHSLGQQLRFLVLLDLGVWI